MRFKFYIVAALICVVPMQSFAWGALGHRITGQIAEQYLTSKAKKEIRKILGNELMPMATTYADFIKSDSTYKYIDNWHYINLDSGLTVDQINARLQNDTSTNIYTKIKFLTSELKKKDLPVETKRFYLKLLIHFVGDVHQPMHVGRVKDLGGNRIRLSWFNEPTNLHRLWDEHLIEFQQLSYTEYACAINFTTPAQVAQWQSAPVSKWVTESYVLAQQIYNGVGYSEPKLSYRYNFDYIDIVNQRLLIGGVRLAGLLNEIFS